MIKGNENRIGLKFSYNGAIRILWKDDYDRLIDFQKSREPGNYGVNRDELQKYAEKTYGKSDTKVLVM